MLVLQLRKSSRNGHVRLARIFHSFSLMEQHIVLVEVVQDISPPLPFDIPMVLIKPEEACSTAEVYKADPLTLLEKISRNGISQDVCIYDLDPPAFKVLPSLKWLKQHVTAAGRGQYNAVFMSGSGSTIVGIGSPDPPQFVYDHDDYRDAFLSGKWQGPTLLTGKKMSGTEKLFQRLLVKPRKGRSLANFILTEEDTRMEMFYLYDLLIYKTSIAVFMNAIRL
ncbi:hypothetical protein CRYUN_Cryun25bG0064300 [Craigia yunnanensis]